MIKKRINCLKKVLLKITLTLLIFILSCCSLEFQHDENSAIKLEGFDTYTIHHEKDNSTYIINVISDSNYIYTIELFDEESNKLQCVFQDHAIANPYFEDVNLDGYMDIVVTIGGTLNEIHDLYIWDATSRNFIKVIFEGFDMLSYFEIYDGYIKTWTKDTSKSGVIQKLVWNGNILILVSEETYKLE